MADQDVAVGEFGEFFAILFARIAKRRRVLLLLQVDRHKLLQRQQAGRRLAELEQPLPHLRENDQSDLKLGTIGIG